MAKYIGVVTGRKVLLSNADNVPVELVQNDKDTTIIDFELSKIDYVVDLSQLNVAINYTNVDKDTGESVTDIYTVDKTTVEGDSLKFSWTVGSNASVYAGKCIFQLVLTLVDADDVITQQWDSTKQSVEVHASLENVNVTQPKSFVDLVTQVKKSVSDAVASGVTDDRIKQIVEQHFEENPVQVTTDNTLSVAGTPADALATGTAVDSLKGDIGDLYAGNPKTRKKVPEKWQNGYIDTSGNLIANNTGYITQELISFDEEGYIYSLKDTFEGFASQFKLWIFIYDLSGNYVRGRNESYAVSNLGDAPKPDTQHKYRFMLSTVNWETFSDSNINEDKANTILQIKKEIQNPYAKKENLNKTDENVSVLDGRVTTLENKLDIRIWKKWNAIGDSITFFDGYEPLVKNALGIESYTNNGQSGFSTPMIGAGYINNMSDDYDLITFFMGTNNFGRCNSIAETKSSCESIFSAMADKWQTADIVIILPIQRWGYTGDDVKGSQPTMTNSDGITLREYCLAIKEVAEKYSFCVLDGYYRSGIIGGENGNTSNYLNDGLHPNDKGNELIANMIVKFLKANF